MSRRSSDSALVVDLVLRSWDPGIVSSAERRAGLPPGALDRAAFADAATLRAVVPAGSATPGGGRGSPHGWSPSTGRPRPERWPVPTGPQDGRVPVTAPAPRLPRGATWGLLAAWAVHDAEELVTMPGWADRARLRLERTVPRVPARVRDGLAVSRPHATVAIGLVGAVVTAASARGARPDGPDPLYQAALAGFGWHAVPHVASAVVTRGYTPGVLTAPTVIVPSALWARRDSP
jgi:uncharacterized protein with HXXEE motif